ncbi:hypothetical protein Trydic_g16842 [Trypoxylus dichotomus]
MVVGEEGEITQLPKRMSQREAMLKRNNLDIDVALYYFNCKVLHFGRVESQAHDFGSHFIFAPTIVQVDASRLLLEGRIWYYVCSRLFSVSQPQDVKARTAIIFQPRQEGTETSLITKKLHPVSRPYPSPSLKSSFGSLSYRIRSPKDVG